MTRDDIIRMAREAGLEGYGTPLDGIERFAALVAAAKDAEHQKTLALQQRSYEREIQLEVEAEREACARVCEEAAEEMLSAGDGGPAGYIGWTIDCAKAIRERSKT